MRNGGGKGSRARGPRFKTWRKARGISRYRVAQVTGIPDQELERLERDASDPRWSTCVILLEFAARHGGGLTLDGFGGHRARERLKGLRQTLRAAAVS